MSPHSLHLIFGDDVRLTDRIAQLAGIRFAVASGISSDFVVKRGGLLSGEGSAPSEALRVSDGEGISLGCAWDELSAFSEEVDEQGVRLILASTRIRFVGLGSLSQRVGEVTGAAVDEHLSIDGLIASVEGETLLIPLDYVEFQSQQWVYVDTVRFPLAEFERLRL
jgi:hypothetical protein